MFERKIHDLHMHLNGSFSLPFLEKTAIKNNTLNSFTRLLQIRQEYEPNIKAIWEQFALIRQIIQTLDDIREGTLDVMAASTASYMEIRTTPREFCGTSWQQYVQAFVQGLLAGNSLYKDKKIARGLLSLDRTVHTEAIAYEMIDAVAVEKARSGMLVGIDICGNPVAPRTLSGAALGRVLRYALEKNIGAAIHAGETQSEVEKQDVDIVLAELKDWQQNRGQYSFEGKVRLGHGIFLTAEQRALVRQLRIAVEICPSCHETINWWNTKQPHPVKDIYQSWQDPVVAGTDDAIIFGGDAEQENRRVLDILGYDGDDNETVHAHHAKFRFR